MENDAKQNFDPDDDHGDKYPEDNDRISQLLEQNQAVLLDFMPDSCPLNNAADAAVTPRPLSLLETPHAVTPPALAPLDATLPLTPLIPPHNLYENRPFSEPTVDRIHERSQRCLQRSIRTATSVPPKSPIPEDLMLPIEDFLFLPPTQHQQIMAGMYAQTAPHEQSNIVPPFNELQMQLSSRKTPLAPSASSHTPPTRVTRPITKLVGSSRAGQRIPVSPVLQKAGQRDRRGSAVIARIVSEDILRFTEDEGTLPSGDGPFDFSEWYDRFRMRQAKPCELDELRDAYVENKCSELHNILHGRMNALTLTPEIKKMAESYIKETIVKNEKIWLKNANELIKAKIAEHCEMYSNNLQDGEAWAFHFASHLS